LDAAKRKVIEAAGWTAGDAADFLEMSDQERQLLDARVKLALAIRQQREAPQLSQKQLGALLNTSQPRGEDSGQNHDAKDKKTANARSDGNVDSRNGNVGVAVHRDECNPPFLSGFKSKEAFARRRF
jgi:predicted XRE-type DNA-binding protein